MIPVDRGSIVDRVAVSLLIVFGGSAIVLAVVADRVFPLLFVALSALVILPWYVSFRRNRLDVFEPILFHSVFVGMIVIALFDRIYLQEWYWAYDVISYNYRTGFLLFGVTYLALFACILVGYYGIARTRLTASVTRLRPAFPSREAYPVVSIRRLALLYVVVGAVFYVVMLSVVFPDGNLLYLYAGTTPRSEVFAGNHVLVAGANLLYLGYFLWLTATIATGIFPRWYELAPLPVIIGLFAVLGGRGKLFSILLVAVILLYYAWSLDMVDEENWLSSLMDSVPTVITAVVASLFVLSILLIGIVMQGLRMDRSLVESAADVDVVSIATFGVQNDVIDNFLALTELVPEEIGYYYGTFYVRVITNFVPSALWADKPVLSVGSLLRRTILPDATGGRPAGQLGDYLINFGYPGVVLFGLLFGGFLRLVYELLRDNRSSPFAVLIYAILLTFIARSGLTTSAIFATALHVLPLVPVVVLVLFDGLPVENRVTRVIDAWLPGDRLSR